MNFDLENARTDLKHWSCNIKTKVRTMTWRMMTNVEQGICPKGSSGDFEV
jgi:hypothetical protein